MKKFSGWFLSLVVLMMVSSFMGINQAYAQNNCDENEVADLLGDAANDISSAESELITQNSRLNDLGDWLDDNPTHPDFAYCQVRYNSASNKLGNGAPDGASDHLFDANESLDDAWDFFGQDDFCDAENEWLENGRYDLIDANTKISQASDKLDEADVKCFCCP